MLVVDHLHMSLCILDNVGHKDYECFYYSRSCHILDNDLLFFKTDNDVLDMCKITTYDEVICIYMVKKYILLPPE